MSEREDYPAGIPCWVQTLQPDPRAALDFYGPLFGWELVEPDAAPGDPAAQATASATAAGGSVLFGPLDVPPAGRLAVLADPAGAEAFYGSLFGCQPAPFSQLTAGA